MSTKDLKLSTQRSLKELASVKQVAINPLIEQQKVYKEPIFPDSDFIFTPLQEDVEKAMPLFVPSARHEIKYLQGVYHPHEAPIHKSPEIAFIGRSNVGKSSLIKELLRGVKDLRVRTSKTPGHTKLVILFQVGKAFMLVDMPGYGFRQPENFEHSAEGYLQNRKNLRMVFLLVDAYVGLNPADNIALDMLDEFGVPFTFVLTKADKAGKRALYRTLVDLKETMGNRSMACLPQPFLVSSVRSTGIPFLKAFIAHITGNLEPRKR